MAPLTAAKSPCYYAAEATAAPATAAGCSKAPRQRRRAAPRGRVSSRTKGSEDMEPMTNAELNAFLETLAKLVERTATSAEEAAQIIREAKA